MYKSEEIVNSTNLETNLVPQYNKLGINFSGGTDSTLLLYMLNITHPTTKLYVYTGTRKDDGMYNIPYTKNVLAALDLSNIEKHIVATWENRKHGRSERARFRDKLVNDFAIEAWVSGFTLNPQIDLGPGRDKRRDAGLSKIKKNEKTGQLEYRPFANLNKKAIAERYNMLNLRNSLLPLTISCEAMVPPRPCGNCYNCHEKFWGFGEY